MFQQKILPNSTQHVFKPFSIIAHNICMCATTILPRIPRTSPKTSLVHYLPKFSMPR